MIVIGTLPTHPPLIHLRRINLPKSAAAEREGSPEGVVTSGGLKRATLQKKSTTFLPHSIASARRPLSSHFSLHTSNFLLLPPLSIPILSASKLNERPPHRHAAFFYTIPMNSAESLRAVTHGGVSSLSADKTRPFSFRCTYGSPDIGRKRVARDATTGRLLNA